MRDIYFGPELNNDYARRNFENIKKEFDENTILTGKWRFFEYSTDAAVNDFALRHGLAFIPQDCIILSYRQKTGATSPMISFNYNKFDKDYIYLTTDMACTIRFYSGRHGG